MNWHSLYLLSVILLIELTRRLSFLHPQTWLAPALGALAYRVSRTKRARIGSSLDRAFGSSMDATTRNALTRRVFVQFWQEMLSWANSSEIASRSTIRGSEYLRSALARGKGVILWESNGFGKRASAQSILRANGFSVIQVHTLRHLGGMGSGQLQYGWIIRNIVHPYLDRRERERTAGIIYLPQDSSLSYVRTLLGQLRENSILCVAADGDYGHRHITLEFLGHPCNFATGMVSLAQLSGASLIPFFCAPAENGGCALCIDAPLDILGAPKHARGSAVISRYAAILESKIRAHPEWYRHWDLLATSGHNLSGSPASIDGDS